MIVASLKEIRVAMASVYSRLRCVGAVYASKDEVRCGAVTCTYCDDKSWQYEEGNGRLKVGNERWIMYALGDDYPLGFGGGLDDPAEMRMT